MAAKQCILATEGHRRAATSSWAVLVADGEFASLFGTYAKYSGEMNDASLVFGLLFDLPLGHYTAEIPSACLLKTVELVLHCLSCFRVIGDLLLGKYFGNHLN